MEIITEKGSVPTPQGTGADDEDAGQNIVRQPLSSGENINLPFAPKYPQKARSKATRSDQPIIGFVIGRLSVGQPVSEQDVYENSTSRYRRSGSLMILREVHRRYRVKTALVLRRDGQWMLVPIPSRRMP